MPSPIKRLIAGTKNVLTHLRINSGVFGPGMQNPGIEFESVAEFPGQDSGFELKDFDPEAPVISFPSKSHWSTHPYTTIFAVRTDTSAGSGVAIGARWVLTAAHVIADAGGPSLNVVCNRLGDTSILAVDQIWIDNRWNGEAGSIGDLALLRVDHDGAILDVYPPVGWHEWLKAEKLFVAGTVPDQFDRDELVVSPGRWFDFRQDRHHLYYVASTRAGQSGAPVVAFRNKQSRRFAVSAIHCGPGALRNPPGRNFGLWLEKERFRWLQSDGLPDQSFWGRHL